jgi:enoyl-CoA hydratase/carnithine racemase
MADTVLREVRDDGVALLTLNRPDRLNAWTYGMQIALFDLLQTCADDERVRVIVVTGAGRGFCPGADMNDLSALSSDDSAVEARANRTDTRPITFAMSIPKPVIAAINGPCAGLGLAFALTCDIRFCAENAKLTTAFSRRGLIAEHGTSWILPRLVGPARALDLLISARVLRGAEAAELGLVNRAVEDELVLEVALEYARDVAANVSPTSMATIKRQVYEALTTPLGDALEHANALMLESFSKQDFAEGVQSFVEKRPPAFPPHAAI